MNKLSLLKTAAILAVFALSAAIVLYSIQHLAAPTLASNQQRALLAQLNSLITSERYNNALTEDHIQLMIPELSPKSVVTIYRARHDGQPVASLLTVVAPNGYNGEIKLLVAIWADNRLAGVRVLQHKETPGLGDYIDEKRSHWIDQFNDRSYQNTPPARWKVKKDDGDFSYNTGATITPRAIVSAVARTLSWVQTHSDVVYAPLMTGAQP